MKKTLFFMATALAFAGCTSDEFLGENNAVESNAQSNAIVFSGVKPYMQRTNSVGKDAATALNKQFVVWGEKHTTSETSAAGLPVYKNYQVKYTENSAGSTETNTHNWEYVDLNAYTGITSNLNENKQTIKYWDYAAAGGYTFTAFSYNGVSYPKADTDFVQVTKTESGTNNKYEKGYTALIKPNAKLDDLYFSDRLPVAKVDGYKNAVTLTFRNFGARVRVGFYETVPGYSVKIDKFYYDTDATNVVTNFNDMTTESTTDFMASLQNIDKTKDQTYTITYATGSAPVGLAENTVIATATTPQYKTTLTLGNQVAAATKLATSAATPTWDKNNGEYTTVFPNTGNSNAMYMKVDYTLTSEDGSGENIVVKSARVIVPAQYVTWKSNYAYTYLFKISKDTNGTTGNTDTYGEPTDPEGLFPITFDAVVAATTDATQENITTVATNSVTTYANGSDVVANADYIVGHDIYVVNTGSDGNAITPDAIATNNDPANKTAGVYAVTRTGKPISEAVVMDYLLGSKNNGITLTVVDPAATKVTAVPSANGTDLALNAVKFTPKAEGTYAYVYATTQYVAPTYTEVGTDPYDPTEVYYMKTTNNVHYAASGINIDNFAANKANLSTKTATGTAGVYDVKIINVVNPAYTITVTENTGTINLVVTKTESSTTITHTVDNVKVYSGFTASTVSELVKPDAFENATLVPTTTDTNGSKVTFTSTTGTKYAIVYTDDQGKKYYKIVNAN